MDKSTPPTSPKKPINKIRPKPKKPNKDKVDSKTDLMKITTNKYLQKVIYINLY